MVSNNKDSETADPPETKAIPVRHEPKPDYDESSVITGSSSQGVSKKKRPGLSTSLVPSKKAMKFFDRVYENK